MSYFLQKPKNNSKALMALLALLALSVLSFLVLKWIVVDVFLLAATFNFDTAQLFLGKEHFNNFVLSYVFASLSLVFSLRLYIKYTRPFIFDEALPVSLVVKESN